MFGSAGGSAYCIERRTGFIYEMPFTGMSANDAQFYARHLMIY